LVLSELFFGFFRTAFFAECYSAYYSGNFFLASAVVILLSMAMTSQINAGNHHHDKSETCRQRRYFSNFHFSFSIASMFKILPPPNKFCTQGGEGLSLEIIKLLISHRIK
jgi:hypothetical protein